jgi:hypothetical protein
MTDLAQKPHTIETFAHLCARLDDGLGARRAVLDAAGLDEAGWQRLRAEWLAKLAAGDAPELASQFAQTYARTRQHPEEMNLAVASPTTPRTDIPPWIDGEDTTPGAPAEAAPEVDVDRTAELAFPLAGPALPFRVPELAPAAQPRCQPAATPDPTEMTLEVPFASPPPRHGVLPFALSLRGRRQRLVRFDTATGKPLAQPYWIDDPTPAAR